MKAVGISTANCPFFVERIGMPCYRAAVIVLCVKYEIQSLLEDLGA